MERRRRRGRNKGRNRIVYTGCSRGNIDFPCLHLLSLTCSHCKSGYRGNSLALCDRSRLLSPFFPTAMSFPQLGYQYIRPIYPPERQGIASNARSGTELSPSGALSNVLSTMYGSPFAAAAQGYGAFLPYSNDISIFNQLVSESALSRLIQNFLMLLLKIKEINSTGLWERFDALFSSKLSERRGELRR